MVDEKFIRKWNIDYKKAAQNYRYIVQFEKEKEKALLCVIQDDFVRKHITRLMNNDQPNIYKLVFELMTVSKWWDVEYEEQRYIIEQIAKELRISELIL